MDILENSKLMPPEAEDIREQVRIARAALDAVDELVAQMASRCFDAYYDACPHKGAACPTPELWCFECYIRRCRDDDDETKLA